MRRRRVLGGQPGEAALDAENEVRALTADVEAERARWREAALWSLLPVALLAVAARLGSGTLLCAIVVACAGVAAASALWWGLRQRSGRLHRAAAAIALLRDWRVADVLAKVVLRADPRTSSIARLALRRLLAEVRAGDGPAIEPHGAEALAMLLHRRDPDLSIAILGALEAVGATCALPAVRRYAAHLPDAAPEAAFVRRALRRCIGRLEALVEAEREQGRLLRPAAGAPPAGVELLRPASAGARVRDALGCAWRGEEAARAAAIRAARSDPTPEG